MEGRVKQFLESGKLELYVYGMLESKDQKEVEQFISEFPEVKREYLALQEQLEEVSRKQAVKAPIGMKSQILEALPDRNITSATTSIPWTKYIAIAGIAASVLLIWAWKQTNDQLKLERASYASLSDECEEREKRIEAQANVIAFLNSEQTQRYDLQGNQLAPNFNAMVFVNESFGKALLTPNNKINLPENKCLQLWGDLNGEMVPIAVLDNGSEKAYNLEINPSFTSLNLTIEEKTEDGKGQLHPDVSQLIASVVI